MLSGRAAYRQMVAAGQRVRARSSCFSRAWPRARSARSRAGLALCVLVVNALPAACSTEPSSGAPPATGVWSPNTVARSVVAARWDTLFSVQGPSASTDFTRPRLLAVGTSQLYVYDYGPQQLSAFDSAGQPLWQAGARVGGPHGFANVTDVQVAPNGDVWAVDGGRNAVVVLGRDGHVVRTVTVQHPRDPGQEVQRAVPVADASRPFPVVLTSGAGPWVLVGPSGAQVGEGQFVDPVLREAAPLARQPLLSVRDDGRRWALLYLLGDRFTVYRDTSLVCTGRFVDGGTFKDAARRGPRGVRAVAVALRDSTVFVVAAGEGATRYRILDEYSAGTCAYRASVELPAPALAMAVDRNTFFLAGRAPRPTVVAVRRRE